MRCMLLLVPSDPLNPRRVDEHFRAQAEAAREAGVAVARVDHDLVSRGGADEAVREVPESDDAVYRGWMLDSDRYSEFGAALARQGTTLRTSPAQFRQAHELPGWYDALRAVTPESVRTIGADLDALVTAAAGLGSGPAVLRDYVKSMKHYWDEAAYLADVADGEAIRRVGARFLELREDAFAGGFVVRRFEVFRGGEVRTWWIDGRLAVTTAHPDTPDQEPAPDLDLAEVEPLIANLGLPFVTVDLVRRDDGVWRVVELGDGQVSDWPSSAAPSELINALV
jgi:hypothetical protein